VLAIFETLAGHWDKFFGTNDLRIRKIAGKRQDIWMSLKGPSDFHSIIDILIPTGTGGVFQALTLNSPFLTDSKKF